MPVSTPNPPRQVRVGVAAVVVRSDGRLILGKRKGSLGAGQYSFPGGHLEFGESYFECAEREAAEETGLSIKALRVMAVASSVFDSEHHYITIFVQCKQEHPDEQPQVLEPENCYGWELMSWDDVRGLAATRPEELFLPVVNLLREHARPEDLIVD